MTAVRHRRAGGERERDSHRGRLVVSLPQPLKRQRPISPTRDGGGLAAERIVHERGRR